MFSAMWCRVLLAFGFVLVFSSSGYPDSSTVVPAPLIQTIPVQSELARSPIGAPNRNVSPSAVSGVHASEDQRVGAEERVVVVMPSRWLRGGELLRRSAYRYPDHDLAGRFVEMSTELPPMFGDEE